MTRRAAFTLVELLVVMSIVAILVAMLLPAIGKAKDLSQSVVCQSNLKQQFLAVQLYSDANRGYGPCETGTNYATDPAALVANAWSNGGSGARWMKKLLPYLGSSTADVSSVTCFSYETNTPDKLIRAFQCPTTVNLPTTGSGRSYGMNRGFSMDFTGSDSISLGASNATAAPMNFQRTNVATNIANVWLLVDSYLYHSNGVGHWTNSINPAAGNQYRSHQSTLNIAMGDGRVFNAARTGKLTVYTTVRNNGVWVTEVW